MDFTKTKDDPHGVQRLLDILRRQQDSSSSSTSSPPAVPNANPFSSSSFASPIPADTNENSEGTEAAKRRRTYNDSGVNKFGIPTTTNTEEPFDPYSFNPFSSSNPVLSAPAPAPSPPKSTPLASAASTVSAAEKSSTRDLSDLTFAESLPILSRLSTDKSLLRRLRTLRTQQHDLEKRLFKEYSLFAATKDKQYPNPKLRREEDEKRRKNVLAEWERCLARQQGELVKAGVPGFKEAKGKREVEKQRKVLAVLVEMLDEEEDG